jgi:hypothetical protein
LFLNVFTCFAHHLVEQTSKIFRDQTLADNGQSNNGNDHQIAFNAIVENNGLQDLFHSLG